ncbi:anthranilate phosphoribosyltransferase [Bisgaardia hudsonensis]|uniref:Anthranilate phosphoribosyltransferase n=1 Tax=Bisgaardia hudsonensis TaxID=109472 RepID=A0A4R2N0H0_9PAST|nr:anthranilate phosphoribosyltransferase [Bisgaardia hudsonensis]QLB13468.1 anthranilate phosphoribosyltransferase [Bisgaardia hudsonensis]TCP12877.1 anthranilate phosphoribosyltransferase [Bisgaardia hudsonensis]
MDNILAELFEKKALTQIQSEQLFNQIIQGNLPNELLAAILIALKTKGENANEMSGAVNATLLNTKPFPRPNYAFADIVGTGGDGANTINISTISAIVAASCGFPVAKHGNRSVSSKTGASDILTALEVKVDVSPKKARQMLDETNFCFLWAQQYHLGFKWVAPVRQLLKTRTIFNILGPLCNPARPDYHLLGVYHPDLITLYAKSAINLGHKHSIVVHGSGLDEVAIHGKTDIAEIKNGNIEYYQLTPSDFGFKTKPLESLQGGLPKENAKIITALLQGKGKEEHMQAVAMNTALLMKLFGEEDLKKNAQTIMQTIASGKPFDTLMQLTQYTD